MGITIRVIVKVIRKTTQLVRLSSINQVKNGANWVKNQQNYAKKKKKLS